MTTKVTIHANHGWPVDVHHLPAGDVAAGFVTRVPAGASQDFFVHSSQDLHIHEVQPHEIGQTL